MLFSEKIQNRLIGFFDLDRDEYRESHGYLGVDEEQRQHITNTAKQAIKSIRSFSDKGGHVVVDESNVETLWECVSALRTCMYPRSSWHREATIVLIYQFLHNFQWDGETPTYMGYNGWGPLIYELSPEQLTYYLWWREEAKKGVFHEATGEYLWLYIYDIVLNTCYSEPSQSLNALQKLYNVYDRLSPSVTHKWLSHQKEGHFIVAYALYNGLTDNINQLIQTYGIDDTYPIYQRIAHGCFKGAETHLLSLASSIVRTKAFEKSDEKFFALSIIAPVFEQINEICKASAVNLLGDICGTLYDHILWSPYSSPVLRARSAAKTTVTDRHISFSIGNNPYIYADGDDLSADKDLADNNYSFYYNDDGSNFHCKGFYYRKRYSGPNETARRMVDYVIRRIQISCRSLYGGRSIKELVCPYKEIKPQIDNAIYTLVRQYYPTWECSEKSIPPTVPIEYKVLSEDQIHIPSKFKYVRNATQHRKDDTQAKGTGFMSEIKKAALLQERFEILKDQYTENNKDSSILTTLSKKIIVPMLELDFVEGCRMWEYVLQHYYEKCSPVFYLSLTEGVVESSETQTLAKVFRSNEEIKKYVFLLDPYENHSHCVVFIRDLILSGEYDLADELLLLYSQNNHGDNNPEKNLYSALQCAVNSDESKWKINSAGIDFLNRWIAKVKSKTDKAKLEASLLSLIDCVEGNASKGAMPFSMFMAEGGMQMLMEDRLKTRKTQDAQSSFSELIEARTKSPSKPAEPQEKEERGKEVPQEEIQLAVRIDTEELESNLKELNSLVGLQGVKEEITSLTNLMRIRRIRSERGMKVPDTSQHLVFSGNPGTGKTTVARIISKIYHALGFLSKGHLVEVDRSGLVAGYVGQTAIKTQEVIQSALGGILFIDEAYALSPERSENDFGQEAIDTILKAMEDHRDDFVVIVAGYDNLMPRFIDSNPGLKSRFNKYIHFPDYDGNDLFEIFKMFLKKNDYIIDDDAAKLVMEYLNSLYMNRGENFGNARDVRNMFEKIIANQADRLINAEFLPDDAIKRITVEDLQSII